MDVIRVTKQFHFEAAHALYGYDGKCKNVHGHSYKLAVTIAGNPNENPDATKYGMVIDFSDLKTIITQEIVATFDHSIIFNKNTPHLELATTLKKKGHHVILVDYQPTCEMMLLDFVAKIRNKLPAKLSLHAAKLQETESSFAQWFASDN